MACLKNLQKSLGSFRLEIGELELPDQGIVAFCGPSGSGKTTLFRIFDWP